MTIVTYTENVKHTAKYEVHRYAGGTFTERITYRCTCGKKGTVHDGVRTVTMKVARAAFKRHVEAAA